MSNPTAETVAEDPEILAAVEARRARLREIDEHAKSLLDESNADGMEVIGLLVEARLLLGGLRDRPGITWQQVEEFLKRADRVLGL